MFQVPFLKPLPTSPAVIQMKAMALQGFRGAFAGPGGFEEKRAMVAEAEARWAEVGG